MNSMSSFFSSVDEADDKHRINYSAVVGKLDTPNHEYKLRFNNMGKKFENLTLDTIFVKPAVPEIEIPQEWLDQVKTAVPLATTYGGYGGYQGWTGGRGSGANPQGFQTFQGGKGTQGLTSKQLRKENKRNKHKMKNMGAASVGQLELMGKDIASSFSVNPAGNIMLMSEKDIVGMLVALRMNNDVDFYDNWVLDPKERIELAKKLGGEISLQRFLDRLNGISKSAFTTMVDEWLTEMHGATQDAGTSASTLSEDTGHDFLDALDISLLEPHPVRSSSHCPILSDLELKALCMVRKIRPDVGLDAFNKRLEEDEVSELSVNHLGPVHTPTIVQTFNALVSTKRLYDYWLYSGIPLMTSIDNVLSASEVVSMVDLLEDGEAVASEASAMEIMEEAISDLIEVPELLVSAMNEVMNGIPGKEDKLDIMMTMVGHLPLSDRSRIKELITTVNPSHHISPHDIDILKAHSIVSEEDVEKFTLLKDCSVILKNNVPNSRSMMEEMLEATGDSTVQLAAIAVMFNNLPQELQTEFMSKQF